MAYRRTYLYSGAFFDQDVLHAGTPKILNSTLTYHAITFRACIKIFDVKCLVCKVYII